MASADADSDPNTVTIDEYDGDTKSKLLTLKALESIGLNIPINTPFLREQTPGSDDYLVIVPLGPAIGSGGAKVACMVWDVTEDPSTPISFTITDRERDTWVEGFPASQLNDWVQNPDSNFTTYPLERSSETRFRLVETNAAFEAPAPPKAEHETDDPDPCQTPAAPHDQPASPHDDPLGSVDTTLTPGNDPAFY